MNKDQDVRPESFDSFVGQRDTISTLRRAVVAAPDKRLALVFSAYPTKHSRIGNAVGLDTPASALALLKALRDRGYDIGEVPGLEADDGDALINSLTDLQTAADKYTEALSPRERGKLLK